MAAHQAPPSLGFFRQEHWSGLPFPSMHESEKWKWSCSVVSDSSRPHGLQPTRLLRPWGFPGKNTGVGCHCLLWEDPLVESKAAHSSIHAWRIPMDWGAWRATVHGVTKSQTQLKWLNRHPHRHSSQRTGNNICVCICWIICWVNHNCIITACFYLGIKHTICSQIIFFEF